MRYTYILFRSDERIQTRQQHSISLSCYSYTTKNTQNIYKLILCFFVHLLWSFKRRMNKFSFKNEQFAFLDLFAQRRREKKRNYLYDDCQWSLHLNERWFSGLLLERCWPFKHSTWDHLFISMFMAVWAYHYVLLYMCVVYALRRACVCALGRILTQKLHGNVYIRVIDADVYSAKDYSDRENTTKILHTLTYHIQWLNLSRCMFGLIPFVMRIYIYTFSCLKYIFYISQ